MLGDFLSSLFVAGLLVAFGVLILRVFAGESESQCQKIFLLGFFVRIVSMYALYFVLLEANGHGFAFADDRDYHFAGKMLAGVMGFGGGAMERLGIVSNPGYFYFVGVLYELFGDNTLVARVFNVFFSSLTAIVVYLIALELWDKRSAKLAGYLFALMPNMIFWSSLQFKDSLVILLLAYLFYVFIAGLRRNLMLLAYGAAFAALAMISTLRRDLLVLLIGLVILWFVLKAYRTQFSALFGSRKGITVFVAGFGLMTALFVGVVVYTTPLGVELAQRYEYLANVDVTTRDQGRGFATRGSVELGGSRFFRINSVEDLVKLPASMLFTLAMPPPATSLAVGGVGYMIYSWANVFLLALIPFMAWGVWKFRVEHLVKRVFFVWYPLVMLAIITILFMGVLRYKELLMPFFTLWIVQGYRWRRPVIEYVPLVYTFGAMVFFAMSQIPVFLR